MASLWILLASWTISDHALSKKSGQQVIYKRGWPFPNHEPGQVHFLKTGTSGACHSLHDGSTDLNLKHTMHLSLINIWM